MSDTDAMTMRGHSLSGAVRLAGLLLLCLAGCTAGSPFALVYPEQRHLDIREPTQLPKAPLPAVPPPATVASPPPAVPPEEMSLDQAIHIALENSKVVRILTGIVVTSSGKTIYDTAISNTNIDVARAPFDPTLTLKNTVTRLDQPFAIFDPTSPIGISIPQDPTEQYTLSAILAKKDIFGGTLSLDTEYTWTRFPPGPFSNIVGLSASAPLNPQAQTSVMLSYTQPLLRGAGIPANLAPIVIARINTEISFFDYKDNVQELVRSVVEAYWSVVFARTDAWVKRQQVEQGEAAYDRAEARKRQGFGNTAEVAQTKVAIFNFKANLVGADANVLQREAALQHSSACRPRCPSASP